MFLVVQNGYPVPTPPRFPTWQTPRPGFPAGPFVPPSFDHSLHRPPSTGMGKIRGKSLTNYVDL